jgi:hypothetical protein
VCPETHVNCGTRVGEWTSYRAGRACRHVCQGRAGKLQACRPRPHARVAGRLRGGGAVPRCRCGRAASDRTGAGRAPAPRAHGRSVRRLRRSCCCSRSRLRSCGRSGETRGPIATASVSSARVRSGGLRWPGTQCWAPSPWRSPPRVRAESVGQAPSGVDSLAAGVAVLVLLLAAQLAFSYELFRQNARLLERVRALEHDGRGARRTTEPLGLARGSMAPWFSERSRSLADLLAPGRPLALAFLDPACEACGPLLPRLARVRADGDDGLDVAMITRGSPRTRGAPSTVTCSARYCCRRMVRWPRPTA